MLFWGLDNTLDTHSTYPCCPLSARPFPMRAWLIEDLPPGVSPLPRLLRSILKWGTAVQNCHRAFLSKHMVVYSLRKTLKRQGLPWLNVLLSSCVSVFPKLNCTWTYLCFHSVAIHPLAEFPSTPRKLCCTCFVMNLHKAMMETSLNHSTREYNTEECFTTVGWFAWVYTHNSFKIFQCQGNGQTYLSGRQEGELFFFLRQRYG